MNLFECVQIHKLTNPKIANSLQSKDSHGYDEISTKILKESIPHISSPLTYLWNRMLLSGTFPSRLQFS
jgi:hypothetical protein